MQLSKKATSVKGSSTLHIAAKAKALKQSGIDVISFTAGEPDFNTPENINKAAIEAINTGFTKYTESAGILKLREAICEKLKNENGVEYVPNQIVVSNGAKHSLTNTLTAILNPGDEVIIFAPFWLSYPEMIKMADGVPVIINTTAENGYIPTSDQIQKAITNKTKAVIINSPCNPSGCVYSRADLEMIAGFATAHNLFVISDEIYEKLIYDDDKEHISIASFSKDMYNRTIIVNGVSKAFSMTGWRIGYTASPREIAACMDNVQSHLTSNPNSIAQMATVEGLKNSAEYVESMRLEFAKRRDYMYDRVSKMPLVKTVRPVGAFYVFVDISALCGKTIEGIEIKDGTDITEVILSKCNVAVVPCADFGAPKHIRLSFATSMENIVKGLDRIEALIMENY
jgi:aspartate aminotransferase